MSGVLHDIRYAVRQLRRSPVFTAVAVLSLGLGIGLNTTIFSVVSALLLRPLPVAQPERLAGVFTSDYSGPALGASSYRDFLDLRESTRAFSALAASSLQPVSLSADERADVAIAEFVSEEYFGVVGRQPWQGRFFSADENRVGAPASVAVLSHGLWRRRFGSDAQIVGRTVSIAGRPFTVIGIAPEGFTGLTRGLATDIWAPTAALAVIQPGTQDLENRGSRGISIIGRLADGATHATAQAEMSGLARRMLEANRDSWTDLSGAGRRLTVLP
jgi:macrolide transport system ATP-binding/permease protein